MPDNFETNAASGGETFASDLIAGVQHPRSKVQYGDDGAATDVSPTNPFPADRVFVSPQTTHALSASVVAGGSADLDSDQVASGKTAKLIAVWVGASVPVKAELKTVTNGIASSILATLFTWPGRSDAIPMPSGQFITVAEDVGAGFDGFRVTATSMDTGSGTADLYSTFFYDEA